jgi:hypothetical protein
MGFRSYITARVTNSIFWDNGSEEIWVGSQAYPSSLSISFCDVEGGLASVSVDPNCSLNWGLGMINADPLFADPAHGDFHLTWDSPCRDRGDILTVTETTDFEGDPRIVQGIVDMGADEFHCHLYHLGDVLPGAKVHIRVVGDPGTPVLLAIGSGVQDPPQTTEYGPFYLEFPLIWSRNLPDIPATGVLGVSATVPGSFVPGKEFPLQALLGPLGDPNSVLTNLMVLAVE